MSNNKERNVLVFIGLVLILFMNGVTVALWQDRTEVRSSSTPYSLAFINAVYLGLCVRKNGIFAHAPLPHLRGGAVQICYFFFFFISRFCISIPKCPTIFQRFSAVTRRYFTSLSPAIAPPFKQIQRNDINIAITRCFPKILLAITGFGLVAQL